MLHKHEASNTGGIEYFRRLSCMYDFLRKSKIIEITIDDQINIEH